MASLQVRELPEIIYRKLQRLAKIENRSLAQEAVIVLAQGLNCGISPKARRRQLLQNIAGRSSVLTGTAFSDPVKLIREDRKR